MKSLVTFTETSKADFHYSISGPVVSLQEGSVHMEKILLLKNKKGPVLQIVYYSNDYISIENFYIGQMLK